MVSTGQLQRTDCAFGKQFRRLRARMSCKGDDLWKAKESEEPVRPWGWPVPWPPPRRFGPECPVEAGCCLVG